MRIVITGARGLVGKALFESLGGTHTVRALSHRELDITDQAAVAEVMQREEPELVVNCAVLQVDASELSEKEAHAINVDGPRNLAKAASQIESEILHFSTNYVFDGETIGRQPYSYLDATNPINVYGRTKLDGELAVRGSSPRSYIVRTAWVYGAGKESFLAAAPRKLRRGESVQAIVDAFSTTTYVRDLAARVGEIIDRKVYGIYHVVNDGTCSYFEFAREAGRLVGLSEEDADRLIVRVREEELRRVAPRPLWTPLLCRLSEEIGLSSMRNWKEALAEFVSLN